MNTKMVVNDEPTQKLIEVIEAACAETPLVEGRSSAELRLHLRYVLENIEPARDFIRETQADDKEKKHRDSDNARWSSIKECIFQLRKLTVNTPKCAFDDINEYDPALRMTYLELVDLVEELVEGMALAHVPQPGERGRPANVPLEAAIAHLAMIYTQFFGRKLWADRSIPERAPFYRFCEAVFLAAGAEDLIGLLAWMTEKVCSRSYQSREIPLREMH